MSYLTCSFCGKSPKDPDVDHFIVGQTGHICGECVVQVGDALYHQQRIKAATLDAERRNQRMETNR